jgi:ABC-2 type transport system ATP-binding protein
LAAVVDDAEMGAYLVAKELRKQFDDAVAVDGVDMTVGRGERVALVGPNGAGKTTTLLMLLGAIEPDEGVVEIDGRNLASDRVGAMAGVGFAAGYLPMPRYLSVRGTLEFFATLHGLSDPAAAVRGALAQWGIERLSDQKTQTLSSGQATLVGLAKAILHEPELVVLDEPTASLDPEVAHRVRQGLLRLNDEVGTAILVTSHDMREVELLGQRLVFLARGKVLHVGPPAEVVAATGDADLEALFLRVAGIGQGAGS